MKRQKNKTKRSTRANRPTSAQHADNTPRDKNIGRRDFFSSAGTWGLVLAFAGGAGWLIANEVSATINEQDLSLIGNGIPAVVQIHDPQCPRCLALQRETRSALDRFKDGELQYLVANIKTAKGQRLASAHGVGHVTLLLFDGGGQKLTVLQGQNSSGNLAHIFSSQFGIAIAD